MLIELLILIFSLLLIADYLHKRRRNEIYRQNGFKCPGVLPVLGSAHLLLKEDNQTVFKMLNRFCEQYGRTFYFWLLHENTIVTADVNMTEAILSSQQVISKNRVYDLLHSWLGTGLLMSTGKKWHTRRKIITPAFHFTILDQFIEVFDQQSNLMVKQLYDRADGKTTINIFPFVCLTALDIIAETAMGVKVNAQMDPDLSYVKAVTYATDATATRFMIPYQRYDSSMRLVSPFKFRKLMANIKVMHSFTESVIKKRRAALEKSAKENNLKALDECNDVGMKKRMALLDVLLQSTVNGRLLSNEDIREEVDTFMFEGHDTTTSGMAHTLYLLARHPEIQDKVFNEIRQVIGDDKNKATTMRDLQELKYLECVIKESLRLHPPVPMIGRRVYEDITLNGKLFPAKTNVLVIIYHILRDPEYFSEPNIFKPERFFDTSTDNKINPFAYVPFSAGPRNCIGQRFAMLEMKSTISKMIRHFELLPFGEDVVPLMSLVLRSKTGMQLGLRPRNYE